MSIRRSSTTCPILGSSRELPHNVLPTYKDVILHLLWLQSNGQSYSKSCQLVAARVEEQWKKTDIPIVQHCNVMSRIRSYHDKYKNLQKPYKQRKNAPSYQEKCVHL